MSITPTGIDSTAAANAAVGVLKKSTVASVSVVGLLPSPLPEVIDLRPAFRVQGVATVTGALHYDIAAIAGDSAGDSIVTADAYVPLGTDAEPAAGTSAATGDLTVDRGLRGSATGTATGTTGSLTIDQSLPTATTNGDSTVVGAFDSYYAVVAGSSNVTGFLTQPMRLAGTSAGVAVVANAPLYRLWTLTGNEVVGSSSVILDPDMEYYNIPPGQADGGTVVDDANLTYLNVAYYGQSDGSSVLTSQLGVAFSTVGTGTSNGTSTCKGDPRVLPWDLDPQDSVGHAVVRGRASLAMVAGFQGTGNGVATGTGALMWLFTFTDPDPIVGVSTGEGFLFVNDSGLIRGNSRVEGDASYLNIAYSGISNGITRIPLTFRSPYLYDGQRPTLTWPLELTTPSDLGGLIFGSSGVGTWHPGNRTLRTSYRYYDSSGNLSDTPEALPPSSDGSQMTGRTSFYTNNYEYINVGYWDGVFEEFTMTVREDSASPYGTQVFPAAMSRWYHLIDPGELGGWYVDTETYRFPGMASSIASEAELSAELFVEPPGALYSQIVGESTVSGDVFAVMTRVLEFVGNATAMAVLLKEFVGVALKGSPRTRKGRGRDLSRIKQQQHHYT